MNIEVPFGRRTSTFEIPCSILVRLPADSAVPYFLFFLFYILAILLKPFKTVFVMDYPVNP
jgi:hypothetical protein